MSKEQYISNATLTEAIIKYNNDNNPIKFYNQCYDFYIETYNIKPIYNNEWNDIIEIKKNFEYNKIDKSLARAKMNTKTKIVIDYDDCLLRRRNEIDRYINEVKNKNPEKGKIKEIEYPLIVWKGIEQIANRYSTNHKFFLYQCREDLVMSAIEKCLRYIGNFSGESSNNAFSYFTQYVHNSFIENLKKEYEYSNFKQKINTLFYESTEDEQSQMMEQNNV